MRSAMTSPLHPVSESHASAEGVAHDPSGQLPIERSVVWKARAGCAGRWVVRRLPWLLRQLPRAILNLTLVVIILILLLACWVPGWMGAVTDGRRPAARPQRTMDDARPQWLAIERGQV
jgi:hypothetical protein